MKNSAVYNLIICGVLIFSAVFAFVRKNDLLPLHYQPTHLFQLVSTHEKALMTRLSNNGPKAYRGYDFVKYSKNRLFIPDSHTLSHFFFSLDSLANGSKKKVNIVHFGDSHINADYFSGKVRENLQENENLGNGGRGFVFPGYLANTNAPFNVRISYSGSWTGCRNIEQARTCDWGLAGIVAFTSDVASTFTINPNTLPLLPYPITKVRVFYPVQQAGLFNVHLMGDSVKVASERIDPAGFVEFLLSEPLSGITVGFEKRNSGQSQFTLQGISVENDLAGIQYHSMGVNGAEVTSFLRTPFLEQNLKSLNPDLVIISLGTNDAYRKELDAKAFKRNYGTLIQRIQKANPRASVLLTTPGDCLRYRKYPNYMNERARQVILELAEETDCAVWDLYTVMGGLKSINQWFLHGLCTKDKVHFSAKGYRFQGDLLYDALMAGYHTHSTEVAGKE